MTTLSFEAVEPRIVVVLPEDLEGVVDIRLELACTWTLGAGTAHVLGVATGATPCPFSK